MRKRAAVFIIALMVCAVAFGAAEQPATAVHINRTTGPITIDGSLSDPGWAGALRFDTWYETNPGDNVPPKVKTVGYVTYDEHFLYIGIDMSDPNPQQIRAMFGDHDQINGNADDFAGVILDTRNDGKTGYEFFVNAHGTQYDAVNDDTSGNEDASPDFFWDSATKIDAHGWSLEMRIPFSSLRYSSSNPEQWGLILYRNYPRERRYQIFTARLPRGGNCFVCHFEKLSGLENLPPGGHLVTAPYMTARQLGQTVDGIGTPFTNQPVKPGMGGDLKWTPNADTALDGRSIPTSRRSSPTSPQSRPTSGSRSSIPRSAPSSSRTSSCSPRPSRPPTRGRSPRRAGACAPRGKRARTRTRCSSRRTAAAAA